MRIQARTIALSTGIAGVCLVPLAVSVTAGAAAQVLLSRGRPAVASSVLGADRAAGFALDGDSGSAWSSVAGAGTQWLRIDLGTARGVDRVKLSWARAHASTYRVQVSGDGSSWTDLYATTAGDGGTDDLKRLGGTGRYLRVLATRPATSAGYALREVQIFGPGPVPPRPSAVGGPPGTAVPPIATGLDDPRRKELAMQLVSSAENSTLNWRAQFGYLEDIGDGRGYTGGIVGFCSGTSDMLALVVEYTRRAPRNRLAPYLPALRAVDGSDSHAGLDPGFPAAWKAAARDPLFQRTQEDERDRVYFDPAVALARTDGLRALGQFAYYDAAVMHGVSGLRTIRTQALRSAPSPARGGDETVYLDAFLDARVREMRTEEAHSDTSRVDAAQRVFLRQSNLDLNRPLVWKVYGDRFAVTS